MGCFCVLGYANKPTRYQDSAQYFLHLMKLNSWSHATYTLLAAGCHLSHAQEVDTEENHAKAHEEFMKASLRGVDGEGI